jgi:hypothetical protein
VVFIAYMKKASGTQMSDAFFWLRGYGLTTTVICR